jgi:hypothetical protein
MADAFPDAKAGWVEEQVGDSWNIEKTDEFAVQNRWIAEHSVFDLFSFAQVQLSRGNFSKDVFDSSRRRLTIDENTHTGVLAYRTFRIHFSYNESERQVLLQRITSGYSAEDLEPGAEDKYGDKNLHREFLYLCANGFK